MKIVLIIAASVFFMVDAAQADIPLLNYSCPEGLDVHADKGGPVYINGKETKLKKFNENYYEATGSGVTISISINPDGSPSVSYTGKQGAHGICRSSESGGGSSAGAGDAKRVAEEACLAAVAKQVGVSRNRVSTIDVVTAEAGIGVKVKVPDADAPWSCTTDNNGRVQGVMFTGAEGGMVESRRHDGERRHGEGESQRIKCESRGGKYDYCKTHATGRVELRKQLSDAPCREYDTWGADGDGSGVWVREGCRAEFVVREHHWSRGSGDSHHNGGYGRTFTCKSEHYAYNHCSVPEGKARGVELVRQISKVSCERGSNWGEDSRGIWVMNGCEGEFRARE